MMNCGPHQRLSFYQKLLSHLRHRRVWYAGTGTLVAALVFALLWIQPVDAQALGPVYALPGTLSQATNRSYDTILTIANGAQFGLVGQNPDIETQIVQYRTLGENLQVKVWGDRYPALSEDELQYIVVSTIQPALPETPTAIPPATAVPTSAPTATPVATTPPTPSVPVAVVRLRLGGCLSVPMALRAGSMVIVWRWPVP
jgi:hypothetical protein